MTSENPKDTDTHIKEIINPPNSSQGNFSLLLIWSSVIDKVASVCKNRACSCCAELNVVFRSIGAQCVLRHLTPSVFKVHTNAT